LRVLRGGSWSNKSSKLPLRESQQEQSDEYEQQQRVPGCVLVVPQASFEPGSRSSRNADAGSVAPDYGASPSGCRRRLQACSRLFGRLRPEQVNTESGPAGW
ncbi:MAG: hypothetical protein R6V12_18585, partial [Candidatus Hydrogenedentota bacterium]